MILNRSLGLVSVQDVGDAIFSDESFSKVKGHLDYLHGSRSSIGSRHCFEYLLSSQTFYPTFSMEGKDGAIAKLQVGSGVSVNTWSQLVSREHKTDYEAWFLVEGTFFAMYTVADREGQFYLREVKVEHSTELQHNIAYSNKYMRKRANEIEKRVTDVMKSGKGMHPGKALSLISDYEILRHPTKLNSNFLFRDTSSSFDEVLMLSYYGNPIEVNIHFVRPKTEEVYTMSDIEDGEIYSRNMPR